MTTALLFWGFREQKRSWFVRKTAGEDKMLGFGSKFHMNAFLFSVHYDGNGPYHSICFALELSPVIYVPRVQIFHVTIQAMFLSGRTQGVFRGWIWEICVHVCLCVPVWVGGEALVAVPVCDRRPPWLGSSAWKGYPAEWLLYGNVTSSSLRRPNTCSAPPTSLTSPTC